VLVTGFGLTTTKEESMKTGNVIAICLAVLVIPVIANASEHSLGVGFHYFRTLDQISDDLDEDYGDSFHEDGVGINFSYRYKPDTFYGFTFELQSFPSGYFDAENAYSPRFIFTIGNAFYIGAGVAWNYMSWEEDFDFLHDDDEWSDAYYLIRGGLEFPFIVPNLKLDLNANYEMNNWSEIDEFDSDYLTLCAGVRIIL
jgi:opacity protein-like surface antigen